MIDLHTHILPGVDDGPQTLEGSVAMAEAAIADGIRLVAATPHVRDDYPTSADEMEGLVLKVIEALARERVNLELRTGGELALERLSLLGEDELRRFGLGGNSRYLLLEFPYYGWPLQIGTQIFELRARGFTPVLGHPERNAEVQAAPERLRRLVEQGSLIQITASSVDGRLGRRVRDAALDLIDRGLAHLLASDAHSPEVRAVGLSPATRELGNETLARWLTEDVPGAIVKAEPLPDRPERAKRRRRRLLQTRKGR
jgi:protein-tyrosine phosphatase